MKMDGGGGGDGDRRGKRRVSSKCAGGKKKGFGIRSQGRRQRQGPGKKDPPLRQKKKGNMRLHDKKRDPNSTPGGWWRTPSSQEKNFLKKGIL